MDKPALGVIKTGRVVMAEEILMLRIHKGIAAACVGVLCLAGCESQRERDAWSDLERERPLLAERRLEVDSETDEEAVELGDNPGLQDYLLYAASNHPGLKAAFLRWKAALQKVPQVRALPDPKLTYGYFLREVETRVGPQRHRFGLMQKFPWPGKLTSMEDAALRSAVVHQHLYEAKKLDLFYKVKKAFYEYYYLARAIVIVAENIKLLDNMEGAVRVRYQAGAAQTPALIQIQVELGKLEDRLKSLQALKPVLSAELNTAIGRPPGAELPRPEKEPEEQPALRREDLLAALKQRNPELEAARAKILAAEAEQKVADSSYWPDFGLGASWIQTDKRGSANPDDNGKDPVQLFVEVSLPIWRNKYKAAELQAEAEKRAAMRTRDDLENKLSAGLTTALFLYEDAGRKLSLFRDSLLPKAAQALETTQTAFTSGTASYMDMIDAERQLLEFRLQVERATVDRAIYLAELEVLCGREFREE